MSTPSQPLWDLTDKATSLRAYAEWFHAQAVEMFLKDKTHGQFLFLFTDDGLASMNPVPANTEPENLLAGVRQAVREHNLYGIITIAEAWTYFPQRLRDHTIIQLQFNEMRVADLKDSDKTEALLVRMENRDGDNMTWINTIVRNKGEVTLDTHIVLPKQKCLKLNTYFETEP